MVGDLRFVGFQDFLCRAKEHKGSLDFQGIQAGKAELPLTVVGRPQDTREALKAMEKELARLRLVRS